MKNLHKIALVLFFTGAALLCVNAQPATERIYGKKVASLKYLSAQSKSRLIERLRLYAEYTQNHEHEKLLGLIANNPESKIALGFETIYFENNTQIPELREKFFNFQRKFDDLEKPDRLGKITDYRITDAVWSSSISKRRHEADDDLFISIEFKRESANPKKFIWDKVYWFNAFYYDRDWYFTVLKWINI